MRAVGSPDFVMKLLGNPQCRSSKVDGLVGKVEDENSD